MVRRSGRRSDAVARFSTESCGHRACLCLDGARSPLARRGNTDNRSDRDFRGAHSCACRRRARYDHAGAEPVHPSRQRRSIATTDARQVRETSARLSHAHRVTLAASREVSLRCCSRTQKPHDSCVERPACYGGRSAWLISIGDCAIRAVSAPGHRAHNSAEIDGITCG